MNDDRPKRETYLYDTQGRQLQVIGPIAYRQFNVYEEEQLIAVRRPAEDVLPFASPPEECSRVTLSTPADRPLAECIPVVATDPHAADAVMSQILTCQAGRQYRVQFFESAAWPDAVIVRFYNGANLLRLLSVANHFHTI